MMGWLRLHGAALGDALRRLAAQPLASAMSIGVLAVAIALPVVAAVAFATAGAAASGVDTDPHVNVYLALEATDADVDRVRKVLAAHPDAAKVRFIPRAEAFEELKTRTHLAETLALLERNPLPDAFTVRIRPAARDRATALQSAWEALPAVDHVQADFAWSQRLARWAALGERLLVGAWVLLGIAVAFIVGHLVRLQVLTRRDEIELSQLIGATAADVRRPFLYQGALEGILAGALAVAIAAVLASWASRELLALTPAYASELKVVFLDPMERLAVVLGAGALAVAGAWLAVGRELRRFSSRR